MSNLRCFLMFALGVALCGCSDSTRKVVETSVPSACKMRGNGDTEATCMTALSSVLAGPDRFDGRRISVGAWVDEVNDVVLLFPSRDALLARDSFTSVVIYPSGNEEAIRLLAKIAPDGPRLIRATGTFHWIREGVPSPVGESIDSNRVGVMKDVEFSL